MARQETENQPAFWQELLIQTLRLSGRVGVQLMRLSLSDMKDLLGVALCRELLDRGYRTADMCVAVGVSRTTIKKYLCLSRELGSQDLQPEALRLAVGRLQDGPVSAAALRRRLPQGDEFDTAEVALTLLIQRGLVVKHGEGRAATYGLTDAAKTLDDPEWEAPLAELAQLYWHGRDVMRELSHGGEMAPAALRRELRIGRGQDDWLDRTLAFLLELGYVEVASQRPRRYRVATRYVSFVPQEERARLRVGLMDLIEKTGQFVETIMVRDEIDLVGQRSFEFRALDADVEAFIEEHREWVVRRLEAMEAKAEEAGGGRNHMIVWAACPTRREDPEGQ